MKHQGPKRVRDLAPVPSPSQARVLHAAARCAEGHAGKVAAAAVWAFCDERRWPAFGSMVFFGPHWHPSESTVSKRLTDLRVGGLVDRLNRPTPDGLTFLRGARGLAA